MKTLIVWYSRGGTTAKAAKKMRELAGGDLFEIKGTKNYGSYFHALGVARQEFSSGELPDVLGDVENFESYDRILVGFPIWYSKCPQIVISFLSAHDLAGKEVFPFCTSGRTGPEGTVSQLQACCKGAVLHDGLRVNKFEKDTVSAWLNSSAG